MAGDVRCLWSAAKLISDLEAPLIVAVTESDVCEQGVNEESSAVPRYLIDLNTKYFFAAPSTTFRLRRNKIEPNLTPLRF